MTFADFSGATSDAHLVGLWLAARPASTIRVYRRVAEGFLGKLPQPAGLKGATVADVVAWMEALTGAPATRARETSTVKSLLSFAHRTGYTLFNVGRALRCARVPSKLSERIVDEATVRALVQAAPEGRDRALVRFLYASGARISECCHVRFADLGPGRVSFVGKGAKTRTVLVPQPVLDQLLALRPPNATPSARVFVSYRGRPLGERDARDVVYGAARRAGVKLSPHFLRHAHASHGLDRGCPLHVIQQDLGHDNISTTSRYLHARPGVGVSQYLADV